MYKDNASLMFRHGGNAVFENGKEDIIDLSANINPLGMPKGVKNAITREIKNSNRYPDNFSNKLREKIAEFEHVNPDWVFCGNGTSDIIFRLPRAAQAKKVAVTSPTFSDYERSSRSYGSEVSCYTLSLDRGFALDSGFIKALQREKPGLVFVCNPNNPTGRLTEQDLIKELLGCCRQIGAWLVVDECFLDFTEQADEYTSKIFLESNSNLVIMKAFTKLFALPGIRLGYALCANWTLMENLYFHGPDWPVSNLAQSAGIAALEGAENFIKQTVDYVSTERRRIKKELTRLGYIVFEAKANFIFLQNPYPFDLREELDKKRIRIRSCKNYSGLDVSFYRIAVSTKQNNTMLLTAMAEITKPHKNERENP